MIVKRGDIIMVELAEQRKGSIQAGFRPCLVIQNNVGNRFSTTTIVIPMSASCHMTLPTHVHISNLALSNGYIKYDSVVLCEQVMVICKSQIASKVGSLNLSKLEEVEHALIVSLGLPVESTKEVAV